MSPFFSSAPPHRLKTFQRPSAMSVSRFIPTLLSTNINMDIYLNPYCGNMKCNYCGCSDNHACGGGCYWFKPDLCSQCAVKHGFLRKEIMKQAMAQLKLYGVY